jgi:hypothetical protein
MSQPSPSPALAADAAPAEPSPAARRAAARALGEARIAMLTRLAELGMELAEDCARNARAGLARAELADDVSGDGPAKVRDPADPVLAFTRAARAVRMTLALQARESKDLLALDVDDAKARCVETVVRRTRIDRLVERAIEAEYDDADVIERLSAEADETLDEEEDWGGFDQRPIGETVARICRDLGLSPAWRARAAEAFAAEAFADETGAGQTGAGQTGADATPAKPWRRGPDPQGPAPSGSAPPPATVWPESPARAPP